MNYRYNLLESLENVRTPFYFYDLGLLRQTLQDVKDAVSGYNNIQVHYALKANSNPEILRIISEAGFGADTVSGGEVDAAVSAGFAPSSVVLAGVGKTDYEIRRAIELGIDSINVESEAELDVIEDIAESLGKSARVSLRLNPEVDAHTHHNITTGLAENKFGIALSILKPLMERCRDSRWIDFRGWHFHIGSQILDFEPYRQLCRRINELQEEYSSYEIPVINVGGGLGIDYDNPSDNPIPPFKEYFGIFETELKLREGQKLYFELGRSLVGQCGSLITKVLYIKNGLDKRFAIVDAGFTDLIRPALYQAHHRIENISNSDTDMTPFDVVGPICESTDTFGKHEMLPEGTRRGDFLALRSAGAYGEVMAMRYNCRALPSSVFSND